MDYQASTSCKVSLGAIVKVVLLFVSIYSIAISFVFAQAQNPLTTSITITAEVLFGPVTYPDAVPSPPGPINMVNTTDVAIFKGFAYPGSVVSVLKNGIIISSTPANVDGSFEIGLPNLSQGTYSFGLVAEDSDRLKSKLVTVTIFVSSGIATTVNGIFLPPTITSDKIEVKKGEIIIFSGRSIPNAEVRLSLAGIAEVIKKTVASSSGVWSYTLNSQELSFGEYEAKALSLAENTLSPYSNSITFTVGTVSRIRSKASSLFGFRAKCDLNNDSRVNLLDFSIMAFWYKRLGFPPKVDLNTDNSINLTDLSILAYCWTG